MTLTRAERRGRPQPPAPTLGTVVAFATLLDDVQRGFALERLHVLIDALIGAALCDEGDPVLLRELERAYGTSEYLLAPRGDDGRLDLRWIAAELAAAHETVQRFGRLLDEIRKGAVA